MRIARLGGPIALIIVGLILALAVPLRISGVDLVMMGYILAGAGALWLILELILNRPREYDPPARPPTYTERPPRY